MGSYRLEKVQKELQLIIGQHLIRKYQSDLHGLVSVTRVVASADLRSAKVYLSHLGTEEEAQLSMQALREARREIQQEVARKLPMKFCPKLELYWDEAFYLALDVENKLRGLKPSSED